MAAIGTGQIDALAHPTGRVLGSRKAMAIDIDAVLQACYRGSVVPLVSADPLVLDLDATGCRRAHGLAVPVGIGTDARRPEDFANLRYGTYVARRGWLTSHDVVNALEPEALLKRRVRRLGQLGVAWAPPAVVAPAAQTSLVEALRARPIGVELAARVQAFMMGGGDPELEAALAKLGAGNALQAAFKVLSGRDPT